MPARGAVLHVADVRHSCLRLASLPGCDQLTSDALLIEAAFVFFAHVAAELTRVGRLWVSDLGRRCTTRGHAL